MFSFSEMSKSGRRGGDCLRGWQFQSRDKLAVVPHSRKPAPGSLRFGYLLAGRCFPESKGAVILMKRPCASWSEGSCGPEGKTGEVKHPERI